MSVRNDMILLRDRLQWLHAFVRDADRIRRAGTDELTRVWVSQTRDVAFEAEDALDEFFYDEVLGPKRQDNGPVQNILQKYFTCFCTQIVVRHELSDRIKGIRSRLDQISQNQREFNIEHKPSGSFSFSTTTIPAWRDDLENTVGFDEDIEILMNMVRNDQMFIISIIGESGLGKQTVAKIIGREMAASPEMEIFVWYHMEPGCSPEVLIKKLTSRGLAYKNNHSDGICTRLWPKEEYQTMDGLVSTASHTAGNEFYQLLKRKRYLLILSGISSKNILNSLRACLPEPNVDKNSGGHVMLILDTESEAIAWHANTMNRNGINGVHMLTRLDQERSGQLFFWKMRKGQSAEGSSTTGSNNPKDSEYLRLVHHITGGLPLAIVLLAGLLRFKEKPAQWDAVLQQLMSDCETQDRQANLCGTRRAMEIIFWASFEDLPKDLKSCFLYFAAYPKNFSYSADTIVHMWIAEGFIKQPEDDKTMEELGHDYLKELVLRCLVEVEEMKPGGGIELARVHKSLMGLLLSEAREAGFMEIQNTGDTPIPPSVRRLSVQNSNGSRYTSTFADKKFPKLRSFICHIMTREHTQQDFNFLWWSRFIRVISVQGLHITELPDEICDMINLRYLRIDSYLLDKMPSSIARLINLQTLDISQTSVSEIDKDFWKIKTLRHVLARDLQLPVTVPLIPSKHKGGGGSELQTLHHVHPDYSVEWSEGNCPLDNMENLRSLEMHNFQYQIHGGTAFRSALKKMQLLVHLDLKGDEIPSYVLTHQNLRSLQTMVLRATVKWDGITADDLRRARPNLIQLKIKYISEVPQSIKEQLGKILVQA